MTQADALNWINGGWKSSPYAKTENGILGVDVDNLYGFQCKDFVQAYSIFLGAPFANGNAIVLANPQNGWTWETSPQPGDVFVKDYVSGGVDYGHTGCVVSVTPTTINTIDQNWFNSSLTVGSPPAPVTHPLNTIKGYQRFNFQGENMTPTSTQVGEEFQALAGRQPTQDELNLFVGLTWFDGQQQYLWPGVATIRQQATELTNERDNTLYPFVNAVCAALNIPITTDVPTVAKAITALHSAGTPLNATNVEAYIAANLK